MRFSFSIMHAFKRESMVIMMIWWWWNKYIVVLNCSANSNDYVFITISEETRSRFIQPVFLRFYTLLWWEGEKESIRNEITFLVSLTWSIIYQKNEWNKIQVCGALRILLAFRPFILFIHPCISYNFLHKRKQQLPLDLFTHRWI